jgi:uncharacterized protein YmfQ (DUF2313 family)
LKKEKEARLALRQKQEEEKAVAAKKSSTPALSNEFFQKLINSSPSDIDSILNP